VIQNKLISPERKKCDCPRQKKGAKRPGKKKEIRPKEKIPSLAKSYAGVRNSLGVRHKGTHDHERNYCSGHENLQK